MIGRMPAFCTRDRVFGLGIAADRCCRSARRTQDPVQPVRRDVPSCSPNASPVSHRAGNEERPECLAREGFVRFEYCCAPLRRGSARSSPTSSARTASAGQRGCPRRTPRHGPVAHPEIATGIAATPGQASPRRSSFDPYCASRARASSSLSPLCSLVPSLATSSLACRRYAILGSGASLATVGTWSAP